MGVSLFVVLVATIIHAVGHIVVAKGYWKVNDQGQNEGLCPVWHQLISFLVQLLWQNEERKHDEQGDKDEPVGRRAWIQRLYQALHFLHF